MNIIPTQDLYTLINAELEEHGINFRVLHVDEMWSGSYYIAIKDISIKEPGKSMWVALNVTPDEIEVLHVKRGTHTLHAFGFDKNEYKVYKHPRYFKKYMWIVRIVHEVIKQRHKEVNQHG